MTAPPAPIHVLLIRDDTIESGSFYDQPTIPTAVAELERSLDRKHATLTFGSLAGALLTGTPAQVLDVIALLSGASDE